MRNLASASKIRIIPVIFLIFIIFLIPAYLFAQTDSESNVNSYFRVDRINALVTMILFSVVILIYTRWAKAGKDLFIRKINGLDEVEEAVGRATEMGKPVLFVPGIQEIDEIQTIAGPG